MLLVHYFKLPIDETYSLVKLELMHAGEVYDVINRERAHLNAFLDWVPHINSVEDELRFLKKMMTLEIENKVRVYAIYEKNQLIGTVDIHNIDTQNHTGEIGYWLSQHVTGQGVMTKAVRLLCDLAFNDLLLNRLEIRAQKENKASQRVAAKGGFRFIGEAREEVYRQGDYVTMYHYELLKRDFKPLKL
ncbi:N-acetyltransferase [Staphylococcus chromogenes]|uniref:N-acetyltransferase n=1 Tax=Staphylococcus chromogenes TaxID=46126 RepID=A0AAE5SZU7_STACR|nr:MULTISPECIES: GNAT family protein [Staphylococcus]PNY93427.1 N-acetyltransferase [Staphylococcus chromogenes]PTF32477.1 N-acetyltransferase [Staphylococcus chromogenes]PTF42488.1 N-acetyltransferase [Staphylococcus chromogenes]PTF47408.1 N-acetyltransferase [Staphylococcus chromogenes]PTF51664.1 N-acetyltransferase [Staphylococcus chromogenes]